MVRKSLTRDFIDITGATVIGGAAIGAVESSPLPTPLKRGTSALIGVGLLSGASKKIGGGLGDLGYSADSKLGKSLKMKARRL